MYKSLRRAYHLFRGVLPSLVDLSDREASIMRRPWHTRDCCAMKRSFENFNYVIYLFWWVYKDVSAVGSLYQYHIALFEICSWYGLILLRYLYHIPDAFAELRKVNIKLRQICPSVRMGQLGSYWKDLHKSLEDLKKINFHLYLTRIRGSLYTDVCIFKKISH
jgi:hypothetical protein